MEEKMITLKDRLNDLSKRNRSIRMLKKYNKWSFDLTELKQIDKNPQMIMENVIFKKVKTELVQQDVNNEESLFLSNKLTTLFRNLKLIEEETGLYDLYIGYPFFSGKMLDGTYVRAPLFLYPVKLLREKKHGIHWEIEYDTDSEPMLNRSLFLAMKKMSDLHVPEEIYDEAPEKALSKDAKDWVSWLRQYGIQVNNFEQNELQPFTNYKQDEIPFFEKGTFQLDNLAILGHFPQGNSALLNDYENFLEMLEEDPNANFGMVSSLINVGDLEEVEVDNLPTGEGSDQDSIKKSEKEKFFVLDTDASQEEIIESMEEKEGLVVHGPPGTGKSQVIVNVIANAIAENKKVLLICQKRAALDVVFQRLDSLKLSNSVSLLHDEKADRKKLYRKLHSRLTEDSIPQDLEEEFEQLSDKIEKIERELDAIAQGLYEVQPSGYRAFDLYSKGKPLNQQNIILDESIINDLDKHNLDEVLNTILSYGRNYSQYGQDGYPLKERKSFSTLEIKDRQTIIEILHRVIEKSHKSVTYLEHFEDEDITPEYSWGVENKLEKIYEDLNPQEKKTLQKLRLWWWTSFTGKSIIEGLLNGEDFNGLSSKEWPKLRESLKILYELANISEEMSEELKELAPYLSEDEINRYIDQIAKGDIPTKNFEKKEEYVRRDFDDLRNMDRIFDESSANEKNIIQQLMNKTTDTQTDLAEHWVDITKQSAYIHWIDNIERKHRVLTKIGTDEFDRIRNQFNDLLEKKKTLSARVLQNRLLQTLNVVKVNNGKAIKEIAHQTSKKRQVWPVRKLVQHYSMEGLLDILPVWLVSPDMASAIFPLEKGLFDLVIFDEASQCTIENGIPAVYRGSKVIIAGDEKQLPPSSLFKSTIEIDEDEEEENQMEESQSLLNLAKRVFPSKMLQWHYRSKSEELINFSNHAFYNGSIQIAPNVEHLKNPSNLQWLKVDGRWINQHNEVEAIAVVDLLKKLLLKDMNKSIGIITFNAKQQDKIQDIIDNLSAKDEEFRVIYEQVMAKNLDERIFVKNIENVQGDERDIIIFSIGYAKNKEGRVYNQFGTLNREGGENRLNVAVTRAKERIFVVSSIEPYELDVANAKNDGPRYLKSYMEYAQAVSNLEKNSSESVLKRLNDEMNTKRQVLGDLQFDSPFESQVYENLTNIGYKVDTQVGMSGYRIDMAIVHPNDPEKYILGIECDGAMYHSSPSAKERDVYRQRFLESKGWRISRIWSRNWWKDPVSEIEKIDQEVRWLVEKDTNFEGLVK